MADLENVGTGDVKSSNVNAHERWGVLLVVCTAPALAEDTAGVEPAGEAERATAARPEALVPWTQGEAKHEFDARPQEMPTDGELRPPGCMHEAPPPNARNMLEVPPRKDEHQRTTPAQGEPRRKVKTPLRETERELEALLLGGGRRSKMLPLKQR
jgi:hypothetical protein